MSNFRSRWLDYTPVDYAPAEAQTSEVPKRMPAKNDESHKLTSAATPTVAPSAETLSRLPWQLERLVSAAACDQLPHDPVMLPSGLVPNLNRYTLGWAAAYLTGDRTEALSRLWQVRQVWQGETLS